MILNVPGLMSTITLNFSPYTWFINLKIDKTEQTINLSPSIKKGKYWLAKTPPGD